jgi:hypothetical protein
MLEEIIRKIRTIKENRSIFFVEETCTFLEQKCFQHCFEKFLERRFYKKAHIVNPEPYEI